MLQGRRAPRAVRLATRPAASATRDWPLRGVKAKFTDPPTRSPPAGRCTFGVGRAAHGQPLAARLPPPARRAPPADARLVAGRPPGPAVGLGACLVDSPGRRAFHPLAVEDLAAGGLLATGSAGGCAVAAAAARAAAASLSTRPAHAATPWSSSPSTSIRTAAPGPPPHKKRLPISTSASCTWGSTERVIVFAVAVFLPLDIPDLHTAAGQGLPPQEGHAATAGDRLTAIPTAAILASCRRRQPSVGSHHQPTHSQ